VSTAPDPRIQVAEVFSNLAATLVGPYGVADLAQRLVDGSVDLLGLWAAGLLLADPGSTPKVLAASTHEAALLELVQVRSGQGPCLAAMDRDDVVVVDDVAQVRGAWPDWAAAATALGITRAYGIPLHRDGTTVGALNLFRRTGEPLSREDLEIARALAEFAAIGILQHQALDHATTLASQLQGALDSRVVIEQAKGQLAERAGITVHEAFDRLRRDARATSRPIGEVARAMVEDGIEPGAGG
jgi:GAF domain-containing protein